MNLPITTTKGLRDCNFDEYWLQDRLSENPALLADLLNANELQLVAKERNQSSGGRLDLLFHDPETDTMYEVEVMLGETDETHIVRTIEYWDIEKKRWPRKNHVAVLIAERINSRFYNVINLLSNAVPIIGLQANVVSIDGKDALHFTKIVDSYEEPELALPEGAVITAEKWKRDMPDQFEVIALAEKWLSEKWKLELVYHERYVAFGIVGKHRVWISWRSKGRVSVEVLLPADAMKQGEDLAAKLAVDWKRRNSVLRWMTNRKEMVENEAVYRQLFALLVPTNPG